MDFFKKKKNVELATTLSKIDGIQDTEHLQKVNEDIYKHSLELSEKNKTLSLLGKLYELSVLALETKELAEKIVSVIRTDLEFELVGILSHNFEGDRLEPFKFASSKRMYELQSSFKVFLDSLVITQFSNKQFLKGISETRKMGYTENLKDIWDGLIPDEMLERMVSESHARSTIIYPLVTDNKEIGLIIVVFNRKYDEIVQYEKGLISTLINVISVAMDKAMLYEQLRLNNEQQATLIHFISHQVKGFLAKSRNVFSLFLQEDYGPLPEYLKIPTKEGLDSGTKGVETVQEILNAANFKKGTVEYKSEPFDLKKVLLPIIEDQRKIAEERGLSFGIHINENDNFEIKGDAEQIGHALKNLIDNSIKYTMVGGVDVSLTKNNGRILFFVKDTGVGIDPTDRPQLFTEGIRGKNAMKVNVESTGYGLFIVKKIVEAHKGRVWVESDGPDKGSVFYIELPQNK